MGIYEDTGGGSSVSSASAPVSGVSFDGMPLYGDVSSGKTSNNMSPSVLYTKFGSTGVNNRNNAAFYSGISTIYNYGSTATNPFVNTWQTIVSTSGTKGKLFAVFPTILGAAGTIDIEVTIDGVVHTYTGNCYASGTIILGALLPSMTLPHGVGTMDYNETQSLLASYADGGFYYKGSLHYYLPSPELALLMGLPYLQWTADMQVRTRSSVSYYATYIPASYMTGAIFSYDS